MLSEHKIFLVKTNFHELQYYRLSVISKIENRKTVEFREILGMLYVVTLDQKLEPNPNPCVEINRQTEVNIYPRKFNGFGSFSLNTT